MRFISVLAAFLANWGQEKNCQLIFLNPFTRINSTRGSCQRMKYYLIQYSMLHVVWYLNILLNDSRKRNQWAGFKILVLTTSTWSGEQIVLPCRTGSLVWRTNSSRLNFLKSQKVVDSNFFSFVSPEISSQFLLGGQKLCSSFQVVFFTSFNIVLNRSPHTIPVLGEWL